MFWSKPPPPPRPPASTSPPPQSREAAADAELALLLAELGSETTPTPTPTTPTAAPRRNDNDADRKLDCVAAFDELFYCYSLGSQFLNVYRYGGLRDCREKGAAWRACLRARVRGADAARDLLVARDRALAASWKRKGHSSEDVWAVRRRPVDRAFEGDFDDLREQLEGRGGAGAA